MGFALREHLSFCFVGRHAVFLDIATDRYFGVSEDMSAALGRLTEGAACTGTDPALARLAACGVLVETPREEVPRPQRALPFDRVLETEASGSSAQTAAFAAAIAALGSAALELRVRGFPAVMHRLREREQVTPERPTDCDVAKIVAGFRSVQAAFSANRRCLLYSLALGRRLQRLGEPFQLVIAVKLAPFAAHCWIQQRERLLNDSLEHARLFTPILIL